MAHVDFLSRNPIVTECETTNRVPEVRIDLTEVTDNWLVAEQQRDSCVREIIVHLNDGELLESLAKTYELRAGILYRKIQRNGKTRCLPVIPRAFRWSVVNHVHEAIMHLGWQKTLDKVYEQYWFEHMSKYV